MHVLRAAHLLLLKAKPVPLNCVGNIGSGIMAGRLAMCCAEAGVKVVLVDIGQANLERGMECADQEFDSELAEVFTLGVLIFHMKELDHPFEHEFDKLGGR